MTTHFTYRHSVLREGDDAVRSARFWIERAHVELRRPAVFGHPSPLSLCVNRALHAVDALMMALGVTEDPA